MTLIPTGPTGQPLTRKPLTFAVNSINRSMGLPDLYPFVLVPQVIIKLSFVHDRIRAAAGRRADNRGRGALGAVIAGLKRGIGSAQPS